MCLPIDKIVADSSEEAIEMYKRKNPERRENCHMVLKHPKFDVYAVVDGHHRYYAFCFRDDGRKRSNVLLRAISTSVLFYLTEHGFFQPNLRKGKCKTSSQTPRKHSRVSSKLSKRPSQTKESEKKSTELKIKS